jgi:hypothetical protein
MLLLLGIVLLFFFLELISRPKKTIIAILGIVVSLVIYLIINAMGTSDTTDTLLLKNPVSQGVVDTTTAGVYTIMVGMAIGVLVIVLGPLMGRYRK